MMIFFKYYHLILFIFFLVSCNPELKEAEHRKLYENQYNMINPFYIDKILQLPVISPNPWFTEKIKQKKIQKILIQYRSDYDKNTVYESQEFDFNKDGTLDISSYFATKDTFLLVDNFEFLYQNEILNRIIIYKYALIGNQAPVKVYRTEQFECFIKERNFNKNDSLFYYPNSQNPSIIKEKIGDFINYLEVFVHKNTSATSFIDKIKQIDSTLLTFDIAQKIITYKDNLFPLESYHLNQQWVILEKCKEWQYNDYNQPILFMEWNVGKKSKHIELIYNDKKQLKNYIFNKKKFILTYKKWKK
ncbi:MAG: hypothetical protein HYU67_01660 [Flavobacteriia bacterium]|nr:hypothetical protein [Flavobacteriia bacterium]